MYLQQLKYIASTKSLSQADLARMAGVSRAAVCKWFKAKDGIANVETRTLIKLANGLGIGPEELLRRQEDLSPFTARFLWDGLYPAMEDFIAALADGRLPAIARLVQVEGFARALQIVGHRAVKLFPRYKKYLKPSRRRELEIIWPLYHSRH